MRTIFFLLLLLAATPRLLATPAASSIGIFELLESKDIPTITLRTNLVQLLENRQSSDAQAALLSWETDRGQTEEWRIELSVRGKYRRQYCDFPPLSLKFDRDDLRSRQLNKHNKIKLVTHCLDTRAEGQQNLLREYLVYKMYQELTAQSYRVQLIRLHYIDDAKRVNGFKRYAFLIEDTDDMAERIGGTECDDCLNPAPQVLDRQAENRHALFQYLIGNTDYSLPMVRNLKLITMPNGTLVPVGYDFDFAGMVNTDYALPLAEVGQLYVQQRVFLGLTTTDDILRSNIELFQRKRLAMETLIATCKLLPMTERDEMLAYLASFYQEIDAIIQQPGSLMLLLKRTHPLAMPAGGQSEHYQVGR